MDKSPVLALKPFFRSVSSFDPGARPEFDRPYLLSFRGPAEVIRPYTSALGWDLFELPQPTSKEDGQKFKDLAAAIKYARAVIIWNYHHYRGSDVRSLCQTHGVPCLVMEQGFLQQSESYWVDPTGLVGDSWINHDLSWVTDQMVEEAEAGIAPYRKAYPLEPEPGRILVPLQITGDTSVLYHAPWRTAGEFLEEVLYRYPGRCLTVRPHPKSSLARRVSSLNHPFIEVESPKSISAMDSIRKSELVVGMTSTTLAEAAALGVPTVALGNHPLRTWPVQKLSKVIAAYWAMRVPREGGNILSAVRHIPGWPIPESQ